MTLKSIINSLTQKGYDIKWRHRKDGGVIITRIGEQKFTGAQGNIIARGLVGETLSEKRSTQLATITRERTEIKDLYKQYRRVTRKWRTSNLPKSAGKMSFKRFKRLLKEEGKESALRYLGEKEKYASGIAYSANVYALSDYVRKAGYSLDNMGYDGSELFDLADEIEANTDHIREEDIFPAYEQLYRINNEELTDYLIKDIVRNVKRILHI